MVAALALYLGADSTAHADDHEVVIGFAVAQSGWMSAHDGPNVTGAMIAIDDINAKGGILGKKIRAVFSDTKSDQTLSAQATQDVIAQGADFVFVTYDYDMGSGAKLNRRRRPAAIVRRGAGPAPGRGGKGVTRRGHPWFGGQALSTRSICACIS